MQWEERGRDGSAGIKTLATEPDHARSLSRTHMIERENRLPQLSSDRHPPHAVGMRGPQQYAILKLKPKQVHTPDQQFPHF